MNDMSDCVYAHKSTYYLLLLAAMWDFKYKRKNTTADVFDVDVVPWKITRNFFFSFIIKYRRERKEFASERKRADESEWEWCKKKVVLFFSLCRWFIAGEYFVFHLHICITIIFCRYTESTRYISNVRRYFICTVLS